jgi:hypothetical protein
MSPEDMQRFSAAPLAIPYEDAVLWLTCSQCGWDAEIDVAPTLAELVQRADEHTEVCR